MSDTKITDSNYVRLDSDGTSPAKSLAFPKVLRTEEDLIQTISPNDKYEAGTSLRRQDSFTHKYSSTSVEKKNSLWDEINHGKDDKIVQMHFAAKSVDIIKEQDHTSIFRFEKPFYKESCKTLSHFMKGFWLDGLSNAITLLANVIGTTIIYIFISRFDDATLQASYGLSMSYFFFIFIALNESSYEITSLTISKAHGSSKFELLTTYL